MEDQGTLGNEKSAGFGFTHIRLEPQKAVWEGCSHVSDVGSHGSEGMEDLSLAGKDANLGVHLASPERSLPGPDLLVPSWSIVLSGCNRTQADAPSISWRQEIDGACMISLSPAGRNVIKN